MVTIRMFGKPRAKESQRICLLVSSSHLIALALLSNRDAVYESLNVEHLAKHLLALPSLPFEAEKLKKCIQKSIKQYRNTKYTMGPSTRAKDWSRRLCPTMSENLGTQLHFFFLALVTAYPNTFHWVLTHPLRFMRRDWKRHLLSSLSIHLRNF